MSQLSHPNILPFYGIDAHSFNGKPALVSLFLKRGHVMEYLRGKESDELVQELVRKEMAVLRVPKLKTIIISISVPESL